MAFSIYKRGQGKYTRLGSAVAAGVVVGWGCWNLYSKLEAWDLPVSPRITLWIATMVPAGLFVAFGILSAWLVNKPTVADFMIAAEGEMKKVIWSSKEEIAVSTFVVIVVVILLAMLIGVTDICFQLFFSWLLA